MIKFEELVEGLLMEMTPTAIMADPKAAVDAEAGDTTPTPTNAQSEKSKTEDGSKEKTIEELEEQAAKNLVEYFRKKHSDLQTRFKNVFEDYYTSQAGTFPDLLTFEKLIYTVTKNSIRNTENIGTFEDDIASLFPLIDLIALVKQIETDTKGSANKQQVYDTAYNAFVKRLEDFKKTNRKMPLEFPSASPWASSVKNRYLEKQGRIDIGKLKLESQELQNKSIYDAVMILLEHRRKSKIKLFKKTVNIGSAAKEIGNILQQPNNYTEGQISFPDKKIDLLYVGATPDLLLSIGKNALALFEQQITEKQIPKEQATTELYKKFLVNQAQKTLSVSSLKPQSTETPVGETGRAMVGFGESFEAKLQTILEQISDSSSFTTGSYTIKDIQTQAKANPTAQQLYKSLKALADYIKTEAEQLDWLGKISKGLSKAASGAEGLMFGVKIPGM